MSDCKQSNSPYSKGGTALRETLFKSILVAHLEYLFKDFEIKNTGQPYFTVVDGGKRVCISLLASDTDEEERCLMNQLLEKNGDFSWVINCI